MVLLGTRNSLKEDEIQKQQDYTIPAVIRCDENETSLKKSIILSAILHPTVAGLVALVLFILMLMGITLSIFDKPKPKINDITFVLVDNVKSQMPINKRTNIRSAKNTRKGGQHNKRREIFMPSPSPAKKSPARKSSAGNKSKKRASQPKNIFTSLMQPKHGPEPKPQPPSARPSLKPPSVPRPTLKPTSPFSVPIPKSSAPTGRSYSTGPINGHGSATSGGSHSGTGRSSAPLPSLAPTGGGGSSGSRLSGGGSGYSGNPGGGGGSASIDSISDVDFSAYIKYIERKIKMTWDSPKGNENKTVVVLFKISKDGRLLSRYVRKSSGIPSYDKAALNAVELAAPFKPLPVQYKKPDIDIDFSFDSIVKQ